MAVTTMNTKTKVFNQALVAQLDNTWLPHSPYIILSASDLVINGSGFGDRGALLVESFSRKALSSVLPGSPLALSQNGWLTHQGGVEGTITKTLGDSPDVRVVGEPVLHADIPSSVAPWNGKLTFDCGFPIDPGTPIFFSLNRKTRPKAPGNALSYGQDKWLRLSNVNSVQDQVSGEFTEFSWDYESQRGVHLASGPGTMYPLFNNNYPKRDNEWRKQIIMAVTSSYTGLVDVNPGGAADLRPDGVYDILGFYPNGSAPPAFHGGSNSVSQCPGNVRTYESASDRWRFFILQNYIGNVHDTNPQPSDLGNCGADVFMDDLIARVGPGAEQRVVLTNRSNYFLSERQEEQDIETWSDGRIVLKDLYKGVLANTGTAYLHVLTGPLTSPTVLKTEARAV